METTTAAPPALPDDLLAGILGRLPARILAATRGVCKAWRELIDDRKLLLRFVLPHTVRGFFINYQDYGRSHFLSRPTSTSSPEYDGHYGHQIDGKFDFIKREDPYNWYEVADHCNGLVLFLENHGDVMHVCNPVTRWSARLPPPCPASTTGYWYYDQSWTWGYRRAFLVFDPVVSPEYKVLLSPRLQVPGMKDDVKEDDNHDDVDDACRFMEWPPSQWTAWLEFSSSTGRWEEKVFVREGEAARTVGDLLLSKWPFHHVEPRWRYTAYWKGALYVHCRGEYLSRFSLVDDKYRVIKSPIEAAECKINDLRTFLGISEKGVYIAAIAEVGLAILRVWSLSECSNNQMVWEPKHQKNLKINTEQWSESKDFDQLKYWTLDGEPQYWENWKFNVDNRRNKKQEVSLEQNVCWNSDDDDNVVDVSEDTREDLPYLKFLGFHPYKEIIFLCSDMDTVVAFHLNSPKIQYLGSVSPCTYNHGLRESFVYTPCLIGD